jgi:hypothetical protein
MYQFEHVTATVGSTQWMTRDYIALLRGFDTWDYSEYASDCAVLFPPSVCLCLCLCLYLCL